MVIRSTMTWTLCYTVTLFYLSLVVALLVVVWWWRRRWLLTADDVPTDCLLNFSTTLSGASSVSERPTLLHTPFELSVSRSLFATDTLLFLSRPSPAFVFVRSISLLNQILKLCEELNTRGVLPDWPGPNSLPRTPPDSPPSSPRPWDILGGDESPANSILAGERGTNESGGNIVGTDGSGGGSGGGGGMGGGGGGGSGILVASPRRSQRVTRTSTGRLGRGGEARTCPPLACA